MWWTIGNQNGVGPIIPFQIFGMALPGMWEAPQLTQKNNKFIITPCGGGTGKVPGNSRKITSAIGILVLTVNTLRRPDDQKVHSSILGLDAT